MRTHRCLLSVLSCLLCAAPVWAQTPTPTPAAGEDQPKPAKLSDLSRPNGIPEVLRAAVVAPYAPPSAPGCEAIAADVGALTAILGEDLDTRDPKGKGENLATQLLTSAVQGLIPYRSVLRKLSGQEKRERRALLAVAAGSVRRGYLKGLGEAQGCAPPAAPLRPEPEMETETETPKK